MSFWGKIFATDESIKSVVDNVASGLDKLVYTEEEKADAAKAERSEARQMVVAWMHATQGQNLARRLISLTITGTWLLQYLLSVLFSCVSIFLMSPDKLKELAETLGKSASSMDAAVMLILAFYFAAPHMGDIARAVTNKFVDKTQASKG